MQIKDQTAPDLTVTGTGNTPTEKKWKPAPVKTYEYVNENDMGRSATGLNIHISKEDSEFDHYQLQSKGQSRNHGGSQLTG